MNTPANSTLANRRRVAIISALTIGTLGTLVASAPVAEAKSKPAYCAKVISIMDSMNIADSASPGAAAKSIKAGAAALRASNPPAEYKKMVTDYAAVLDKEAAAIKSATAANIGTKMASLIQDKKNAEAISKMVLFAAKTCL